VMGDSKFLSNVKGYDKDNVSATLLGKVKK
jgi:hypothetical protein